jgi:hypothetical protein
VKRIHPGGARAAAGLWALALASGLCAFLFPGCAGFRSSPETPAATDPYALFREVREHAARLKTFEGRAEWAVSSEEGSFRGSSRVAIKTPDSLWMKVEGPFGIDAAFLSFTPGRIVFYSPMLKAAFSGEPGNPRLAGILPFGADFSDSAIRAAGLMVPGDTLLENLTAFTVEKKEYVLGFDTGDRVWINKKGPVVRRWEKRDSSGTVVWLWEADRFQSRGKIRLPILIRLDAAKGRSLTVFYETARANSVLRKGWCDVPIPENVETKPL